MVEKRGLDANGGTPQDGANAVKKPRFGPVPDGGAAPAVVPAPAPAAPPAGPSKPALSLEALQKAKRALELQKQLKEKVKKLQTQPAAAGAPAGAAAPVAVPTPVVPGANPVLAAFTQKAAQIAASFGVPVAAPPAAAALPTATAPGFRPAPLRLDAYGREIDEHGKVIQQPVKPVTSLKVNQQQQLLAEVQARAEAAQATAGPATAAADPFFDPRMGDHALSKLSRRKRSTFEFVQEGTFQKQAEIIRLKAQYGEDALKKGQALPKGAGAGFGNANLIPIGGGDANKVPIGGFDLNKIPLGPRKEGAAEGEEQLPAPEPVPDIEWWDKGLLLVSTYEDMEDKETGKLKVKESKITNLVEHPVSIEPPAEAPPPPPQPLKLTKKELKKLRTQRRQAREKEKQELISQGLLEPPKPKVRIANLYRVLGEQAVADPTALEMETKRQMAERQAAHDDRNLARMLTPAEKREKKLRKMFDDTGLETLTCVYKLARLDNPQHRFKVDVNAKENHMTGVTLITDNFALVVVEGCNKSIKRYNKLMLRRIDWNQVPEQEDDVDAMQEEEEGKEPNYCDLIWQGVVKQHAFKDFRVEKKTNEAGAQQLLEKHGVAHYWDIAVNFIHGESPPVTL